MCKHLVVALLSISGLLASTSVAAELRVAYLEGSRFSSYIKTFDAVQKRVRELGITDQITFPVADACYSGDSGLEKAEYDKQLLEFATKLLQRRDIDMIFSAGTAASQALLKAAGCLSESDKRVRADNPECKLPLPVVASSVSDAVKSGFVINQHDSGTENYTVRIIPERYSRMFRIFHDEVRFKKLGLLYVDDDKGRQFANVEDAETVANERGFQIIRHILSPPIHQHKCEAGLKDLVKQGIDAFYMSVHTCFEWGKPQNNVYHNLQYLIGNNVRIFARQGSRDVKAGALLGFSTIDFSARGNFIVDMMVKIMQGATPRGLAMIDKAPPTIALNLYVAQKIGFDPSFDILGASDEIYQEIILPEDTQALARSPCDVFRGGAK
jgi:hypothetical protein